MEDIITPPDDRDRAYTITKTGNWFLASEIGYEVASSGLSITQNPGALQTPILDNLEWYRRILTYFIFGPLKMGAYTLLWRGRSHELSMEGSGGYIIPWERRHPNPKKDLLKALKSSAEESGTGREKGATEWCDQQIAQYL